MNVATILWWFGVGLLALAVGLLGPFVATFFMGQPTALAAWGISIILCSFVGLGLLFIAQNKPEAREAKGGMREIVLVLVCWWTIVPFFAALPFLLQGYSLLDGWYEAVSAMTTTGAWLSQELATNSVGGMLWRAELQWLGGLVSLAAAAAVFIRPEFIGVDTVLPPFSRGEGAAYLQAFRSALLNFLPALLIIGFGASVLLAIAGVSLPDSLVIGLSLTASGGFVPAMGGISTYGQAVPFIGALVMTLSAISFVTIVSQLRLSKRRTSIGEDQETPAFFVLAFGVSAIFLLSLADRDWGVWPSQLFNAISILSTNGLLIGDRPALIPVLVTAIVGGAAISTAGGLKLLRWLITFSRAREEVWKLIHPQGVSGRPATSNELGVWIHYISFTIILSILVLTITIFGHSLELAVTTAVAVISNTGPIIALSPGNISQYDAFQPSLRSILALGMIIGRLEMVVVLAVFNRYFWRS